MVGSLSRQARARAPGKAEVEEWKRVALASERRRGSRRSSGRRRRGSRWPAVQRGGGRCQGQAASLPCCCPRCTARDRTRPSALPGAAPGLTPGLSRARCCRRARDSRSEWCLVGSELRGVCRARRGCRVRATHPSAWCDDALRRRACDLRYRVSRHVLRCRSARCALCVVTEHARLRGHVASPRGTW
jgi:hypothetical protein